MAKTNSRKGLNEGEIQEKLDSFKEDGEKIKYLKNILKVEPLVNDKIKNFVYKKLGDSYLALVEETNNYLNGGSANFFEKVLYGANISGNLDRAGEFFEKAKYKKGLSEVGDWYLKKGNTNVASEYYQKAGDRKGLSKAGEMDLQEGFPNFAGERYEEAKDKKGLLKVGDAFNEGGYSAQASEAYKKAGLNKEEIEKRMGKKNKLEKAVLGFSALAGFVFSIFFLSSNMTGNVVGSLDSSSYSVVGLVIFIASILMATLALKKN